ncbi:polysaccharide deacetylase family protein [candidate division WOR-3 bacterium]|nr:polysaccharide deacetylase family protein [candidate division WOR-3 bacterium]
MVKAIQFHKVTPEFQTCGTWNRPEQFERFIELACRTSRVVMPAEGEAGLVITFDDGDESVYRHAFPILKKHGVRAVVFLIAGYIGARDHWDIPVLSERSRHLSWDEIREMKEWGIEFGSHTVSHRNLTRLTRCEIEYELLESKRIIEAAIGPISCISYPFNRVNGDVIREARRAGYTFGFGGSGQSVLAMKKEAVYITDNIASFSVKINERPKILYQYDRIKQRVINYFTITTMLVKR